MANSFELVFDGSKLNISKHEVAHYTIFRVIFSDKRQPLNVSRAVHAEGYGFWTSIPEGRQKEAEKIGDLITQYLASRKDNNNPDDVLL